jgi:hypothetical protein
VKENTLLENEVQENNPDIIYENIVLDEENKLFKKNPNLKVIYNEYKQSLDEVSRLLNTSADIAPIMNKISPYIYKYEKILQS